MFGLFDLGYRRFGTIHEQKMNGQYHYGTVYYSGAPAFVRTPPNPTKKHADGTRMTKAEKKRTKRISRLVKILRAVEEGKTAFKPSPARMRALEAM